MPITRKKKRRKHNFGPWRPVSSMFRPSKLPVINLFSDSEASKDPLSDLAVYRWVKEKIKKQGAVFPLTNEQMIPLRYAVIRSLLNWKKLGFQEAIALTAEQVFRLYNENLVTFMRAHEKNEIDILNLTERQHATCANPFVHRWIQWGKLSFKQFFKNSDEESCYFLLINPTFVKKVDTMIRQGKIVNWDLLFKGSNANKEIGVVQSQQDTSNEKIATVLKSSEIRLAKFKLYIESLLSRSDAARDQLQVVPDYIEDYEETLKELNTRFSKMKYGTSLETNNTISPLMLAVSDLKEKIETLISGFTDESFTKQLFLRNPASLSTVTQRTKLFDQSSPPANSTDGVMSPLETLNISTGPLLLGRI